MKYQTVWLSLRPGMFLALIDFFSLISCLFPFYLQGFPLPLDFWYESFPFPVTPFAWVCPSHPSGISLLVFPWVPISKLSDF